jgi:hypothetical protein
MVSYPPQVNYVASCPMHLNPNEKEPLSICSPSLDLDPVVDMVNHSIGDLEPDLPLVTPTKSLNMYSFHSIVLPFYEDLLESMVKGFEKNSHFCVKLVKK